MRKQFKRGFTTRRNRMPIPAQPVAPITQDPTVKRKRGRPRKNVLLATAPLPELSPVQEILTESRPSSWDRLLSLPALPGMTPTPFGSILSRRLAYRYLRTDAIAFRDYMIPKISKRGYWHRYAFSPLILASMQGDTILRAGRASGKSFAYLEPMLVQNALNAPGQESLLTSLRKTHIVDRMERVIEYLETPELIRFVKKITRSPIYTVQLWNGHMLYAASVGDDPEAKMIQGKHPSLIAIEESHQYHMRAWTKLQGAKDPRGCRVAMIGVPDGRTDTPYRLADTQYPSFTGRRFQISRRTDPNWTQLDKATHAVSLGGLNSDLFKQEIDAEWGNPAWSAWDINAIYACWQPDITPVVIKVDGRMYREQGWTPREALAELPAPPTRIADAVLVADVGYTSRTEAGLLVQLESGGPWTLWARVQLENRMDDPRQAEILWELARRYQVTAIGVDATEGEGRAIAVNLDTRMGRDGFVTRVIFSETLLVRTVERNGEPTEEYELAKSLGTRLLRAAFVNKSLRLSRDEQLVAEFNQEMEYKTQNSQVLVRTPASVHIPDMLRVFVLTQFIRTPEATMDDGQTVLPLWAADPFLAVSA